MHALKNGALSRGSGDFSFVARWRADAIRATGRNQSKGTSNNS